MRPWIASLQPGVRYRFQTRDNRVSQIGVYVGIERRNFIFMVNGHRTRYPIRLINPVQTGPRPGIEDAFVRLSNGGGGKTKRRKS
jgi:hypothetical protein